MPYNGCFRACTKAFSVVVDCRHVTLTKDGKAPIKQTLAQNDSRSRHEYLRHKVKTTFHALVPTYERVNIVV